MKALRVMGGHEKKRTSYSMPRNSVKPSQSLIDQVFPFVQDAIASLNIEQTTAMSKLAWLLLIGKIVLHDTACMMLAGREHCIFNLPVFKCDKYKQFLAEMKAKLDDQVVSADRTIDEVLPGVLQKFDGLQSGQSEMKRSLAENTTNISEVKNQVQEMNKNCNYNTSRATTVQPLFYLSIQQYC